MKKKIKIDSSKTFENRVRHRDNRGKGKKKRYLRYSQLKKFHSCV